jgi:hypothetical protein
MPPEHSNDNYITADYMGTLLLVDPEHTSGTSVNTFKKKVSIELFPNPAKECITVNFHKQYQANNHVEIIDMNGKSVMQTSMMKSGEIIDISMLPGGLYNLKINSENGQINSKFLKK